MDSNSSSNRKRYIIGKKVTCDIVLSHPSVSGSHACIIAEPDGSYTLIDIGSTNGVAIYRTGRWQRLKEERVSPKDRVCIGEVERTVSELLVQLQDVISTRTGRKLFISYRRLETEQVAGRIFDFLSARYGNDRIFFDTADIPAASDFRKHVQTALNESVALLAIIGPNWSGHERSGRFRFWQTRTSGIDYIEMEIEIAISDRVPIIPLLVMGASMPMPTSLPEAMRPVAYLNAVSVRAGRDFVSDMTIVTQTIDRYLRSNIPLPPQLPEPLRKKLIDTLTSLTIEPAAIRMHATMSELPFLEINWQQAPLHLWNEVIQTAIRHRKLEQLVEHLMRFYEWNAALPEVDAEVRNWTLSEISDA